MCAVIDGYKMFRVYDKLGISTPIAARCEVDAKARSVARGVKDPQYAQWHECYGDYVKEPDEIERSVICLDIKEMIWQDIAGYP